MDGMEKSKCSYILSESPNIADIQGSHGEPAIKTILSKKSKPYICQEILETNLDLKKTHSGVLNEGEPDPILTKINLKFSQKDSNISLDLLNDQELEAWNARRGFLLKNSKQYKKEKVKIANKLHNKELQESLESTTSSMCKLGSMKSNLVFSESLKGDILDLSNLELTENSSPEQSSLLRLNSSLKPSTLSHSLDQKDCKKNYKHSRLNNLIEYEPKVPRIRRVSFSDSILGSTNDVAAEFCMQKSNTGGAFKVKSDHNNSIQFNSHSRSLGSNLKMTALITPCSFESIAVRENTRIAPVEGSLETLEEKRTSVENKAVEARVSASSDASKVVVKNSIGKFISKIFKKKRSNLDFSSDSLDKLQVAC
ncbi:hypothetical protein HDU92_007129 [Lobulomyces angularis]|nr:hypothetical protein HDU92_007129 [Lobulomyces angularis]